MDEPRKRAKQKLAILRHTPQMRIFLRNTSTRLLYVGPEEWTEDPAAAFDFEMPDRALDRARSEGLAPVELLMHFDNPAFEVPLTIVGLG